LWRLKAKTKGAEREPGQITACSIPNWLQISANIFT